MVLRFRCFAQGDEALFGSVGLSGRVFAASFRAATSFHSEMRHNLTRHTRVAPELDQPGAFSEINTQQRPSQGRGELHDNAETPQFDAMGQWLLGVAQDLLDPQLYWAAEKSWIAEGKEGADVIKRKKSWERLAASSGWRVGSSGRRTRMTPRQRFEFLTQQVH